MFINDDGRIIPICVIERCCSWPREFVGVLLTVRLRRDYLCHVYSTNGSRETWLPFVSDPARQQFFIDFQDFDVASDEKCRWETSVGKIAQLRNVHDSLCSWRNGFHSSMLGGKQEARYDDYFKTIPVQQKKKKKTTTRKHTHARAHRAVFLIQY